MPILIAGMVANQRRMVWVQIILVFVTIYFATPPNAMKRKVQKAMYFLVPLAAIYVAVGWNVQGSGGIFGPVQTIRSSVDSEVDASTLWRDVENFDLIFTIRQNPIFGTGYGHGFIEIIPLPPVDYLLERFIPHNSILGLWAYCGYVGYTAMTLLWVAGVYFAMRSYHHATQPTERAAAMACVGAVLIYYLQCYGDMGLGSWTGVYMMGAAIAAAGKLAVATGAWPSSAKRGAGAPAATPAAAPRAEPTAAR
jgi:O-antigen ligase